MTGVPVFAITSRRGRASAVRLRALSGPGDERLSRLLHLPRGRGDWARRRVAVRHRQDPRAGGGPVPEPGATGGQLRILPTAAGRGRIRSVRGRALPRGEGALGDDGGPVGGGDVALVANLRRSPARFVSRPARPALPAPQLPDDRRRPD